MKRFVMVATAVVLVIGVTAVARAENSSAGPCTDLSRSCVIEVARTYVDAQAGGTGTADAMRLAPTAIRWENGVVTGTSGADIRSKSGGGPSPIISPRDVGAPDRVFVDGGDAFFLWMEDVRLPSTTTYTQTAHIFERVRVTDTGCNGLTPCISEIEAIFCIGNHGQEPAKPQSSTAGGLNDFLCLRSGG